MATIILSILIFGTAGIITYQRIKKGKVVKIVKQLVL